MRGSVLAVTVIAALIGSASPAPAHHSFAAEFDGTKPVTLTGTVTKMEWSNPHIYLFIDVKDERGTVTNWALEGGAPNGLYRNGWRKDTVKVGDIITVQAFHARDGSHLANMRSAVLSDGRRVLSGQQDGGPEGRQ
jgi:hypothetical protein